METQETVTLFAPWLPAMTNHDLRAWLKRVGMPRREAAAALAVSPRTLESYLRETNAKRIPRFVELLAGHVEAARSQRHAG